MRYFVVAERDEDGVVPILISRYRFIDFMYLVRPIVDVPPKHSLLVAYDKTLQDIFMEAARQEMLGFEKEDEVVVVIGSNEAYLAFQSLKQSEVFSNVIGLAYANGSLVDFYSN